MKARLLQPPLCTTPNRRAGCPFEATAGWRRYPLALAALFAMSICNIIGLYLLMPVVKTEYLPFIAKVESGEFKRYLQALSLRTE